MRHNKNNTDQKQNDPLIWKWSFVGCLPVINESAGLSNSYLFGDIGDYQHANKFLINGSDIVVNSVVEI